MTTLRTIELSTARRLAVAKQHLAGPRPTPTTARLLEIARDLGCLQLDPLSVVARSHTLVLMSRAGPYDVSKLDALVYGERRLFEYWAHAASLVLTEDFPVHQLRMRSYAREDHPWHRRIAEWIDKNKPLRDSILREIRRVGPVPSRLLTEGGHPPESWVSSGWTGDRNVSRMLDFLWMQGKIMVAQRQGLTKYWDLTERVLPDWTPRDVWSERKVVQYAAQKSLQALGVGTARHIERHYTSGRYPDLPRRLEELEKAGQVERVRVAQGAHKLPREWYIHTQDLPRLEAIERGEFEPRTTVLSPFDNLIRDRVRTLQLWDFDYKIEIYTPQAKRKYGYYVLPILAGERLIGRVDPAMRRGTGVLDVHAVHAEADAPRDRKTARAVRGAIEELGRFLGAKDIRIGAHVPEMWRRDLQA